MYFLTWPQSLLSCCYWSCRYGANIIVMATEKFPLSICYIIESEHINFNTNTLFEIETLPPTTWSSFVAEFVDAYVAS